MWMQRLLFGLGGLAGLLMLLALSGWGYMRSLDLEAIPAADPATVSADLDFLRGRVPESRGRILAVVTNTPRIPGTARKAGFELTELARAYYVFQANGYAVDIASPRGGMAPMVVDDDLIEADYAFLNDVDAQQQVRRTLALADVDSARYAAVYFVGGKGAMFDFPDDPQVQRIVRNLAARGVVGAVCHGPAALLNATAVDGSRLLAGRQVTGFSNDEELFLIENARDLFPYLLEDQLRRTGARYSEAPMYLDHVVVDGRLITGQNPWSTWSVAKAKERELGHEPVPRAATSEELGVRLLGHYRRHGLDAALTERSRLPSFDRRIVLMHALVAAMRGEWGEAWQLQQLGQP